MGDFDIAARLGEGGEVSEWVKERGIENQILFDGARLCTMSVPKLVPA